MRKIEDGVCYITRKGEEKLWEKYNSIEEEYVKTTQAMRVSDSMDSDLRENPEFMELRVKAMYALPKQKKELYEKLKNVVIIDDMEEYKQFDGKMVIMGSVVTLDIDGDTEVYTILGTEEGNVENGIINVNAGLAQAIIYHEVGEVIPFNGMILKILKVEKAVI